MKAKSSINLENETKVKIERQIAIILAVVVVILAMIVPLISGFSSDTILKNIGRLYQVGELAEEDIFATEDFLYMDETKTNELIADKMREILPRFSFSLRQTLLGIQRVDTLVMLMNDRDQRAIEAFLDAEDLHDDRNVVVRLMVLNEDDRRFFFQALEESADEVLRRGLFRAKDIQALSAQGFDRLYLEDTVSNAGVASGEVTLDDVLTKENLAQGLRVWMNTYHRLSNTFQPYLLTDTLIWLLEENVQYQEVQTLALRQMVAESTNPVMVQVHRGDRILAKDTVVTAEQLSLLNLLGNRAFHYTVLELIGRVVFILMSTTISIFIFIQFIRTEPRLYLYLNLMLASIALSLLAMLGVTYFVQTRSMTFLNSFLPVLFAPVFTAHITSKKRLGLVAAFLISCYAVLMPESNSMTFFFALTIGGVCLFCFQYTIQRLEDLFNWLYACIISCFAAVALNLLIGLSFDTVFALVGGMILNITISLVFVEALVPLCERIFNIPTAFRLSELAFLDSPLLERLSTVAQGTYNHSRNVSELAYQAAKAIGANAMLARVGGIYHDIGKSDHPEYFIENQSGENKHDDIKPSLSVAVIKSHVKLGLEKGREAGLPQEVLDIIAQHHGDDVIQFFYNEAKEQAQAMGLEVNEDDYSYNGIPPTFPESAIVMLADCVEAASRTLKKPNHSKYQKLVHSIIMGKIERRQLKNSRLSMTDLEQIEEALVQALIGRDHYRIEYPDDIKDAEQKPKGE